MVLLLDFSFLAFATIYSVLILHAIVYPNYLEMQVSARREATIFKAKSRRTSHSSSRFYNKEDGCFPSCPTGAQVENLCRVAYMDVGKGRELGAEVLQLL